MCPEYGNVDPKAYAEPVSGSISPNRSSSKFDILHILPYHFSAKLDNNNKKTQFARTNS